MMLSKALLGLRIREHRVAAGFVMEGLARVAEISYSTLSAAELGKTRPDTLTLEKIASALGLTLDGLMYGSR